MKNPAMMQLTVEVGRCTLPSLLYSDYSLSVRLTNDLSAATSFRSPSDGRVDFGTRLFLRMEKAMLEATPQCSVAVTAIGEKASRIEIARGEASIAQDGRQQVRLAPCGGVAGVLEVELQFCRSAWEPKQTKTNNMRTSNSKSHLSQKQSSCEQKQSTALSTPHSLTVPTRVEEADRNGERFSLMKGSHSEKILPDQSTELETSANTIQHAKTEENLNKSEDSEMLLGMQIKIDQLEERIQALHMQLRVNQERLAEVNAQCELERGKREQMEQLLDGEREKAKNLANLLQFQKDKNHDFLIQHQQERVRVSQLQQAKQQLSEMLILQEEKNNISLKHIQRLTKLLQSLGEEAGEFNPIEEKDEIIMLNQELENELTNKNIAINQMKLELEQLRQRIVHLEIQKAKKATILEPAVVVEKVTSTPAPTKSAQVQKPKVQKKPSQKVINHRKSQPQIQAVRPKEAKKPKEKQIVQKKQTKIEPAVSKKPAVPVPKNTREVKSPTAGKAETVPSPRPKAKGKMPLKIEQKTTMDSDKKSQAQSLMTSMVSLDMMSETNLMIHSRSHQADLSKLQQAS